ncbi:hypothetical protein CDV31_015364 [Fusarium ambrosium]|uniref:Uncharacterized protein n=1 Tax=Fusarium ambrosium TaxID=131363 RepID=A0A428SQ96_9HYPO|nr:hypothetical protein CDV31_015364 [Fusarium ambrosium]
MPSSRMPQNDDSAFNSAWDKIKRRKGRKRRDSTDSIPQPGDPPGQNDPPPPSPFTPFSPLPNINGPLPRVPPSRHSTRDTLPDISESQTFETNDTQQHDAETPRRPAPQFPGQPGPSSQPEPPSPTQSPQESSPRQKPSSKTANMQKAVNNLSTLVAGLVDCIQTARGIFILLFKTIYLFLPIFLIRWILKTIVVILIILHILVFASESIHRGFCHMAPQVATPLLATALVDMANCAAIKQDAPSTDSSDTLDGLVAMVPPVWGFLAKNGGMVVREFPDEWETGTYIKQDFESFSAKFKDAASDIQALEDEFNESQKRQWNVVDDFISKFNNIPPNAVWYRFLDSKVYDVKAHNSHLISILKDAQSNTRQALANIPTDKATGIYGKLFNLEGLNFYEDIREAFM